MLDWPQSGSEMRFGYVGPRDPSASETQTALVPRPHLTLTKIRL